MESKVNNHFSAELVGIMARLPEISVLTVGYGGNPVDLLKPILNYENVHFSIVCSNILDYDLPTLIENGTNVWYRDELRTTLKTLASEIYNIPESLKSLLLESDRLQLSEKELAINYHINQIQQNSGNIEQSYELLSEETERENLSFFPLVTQNPTILAFKQKKYAPLRYYYTKNELLKETPPEPLDKTKRKYDDKKLAIENFDNLKSLKLNEKAHKAFQESDLIIILPSDVLSLNFLLEATEIENQIKKINTPIVLIWPFSAEREISKIEKEIATTMGFGTSLNELSSQMSDLTDYIIIDKSDKDQVDLLREVGCHVLVNDIQNEVEANPDNFLQTIFSIANIHKNDMSDDNGESDAEKKAEDKNSGSIEEKTTENNIEKRSKSISQLTESPEEAGSEKIKEKISIQKKEKAKEEQITKKVSGAKKTISTIDDVKVTSTDETTIDEKETNINREELEVESKFGPEEDEEWIDTVSRGIKLCFETDADNVVQWLSEQSKIDADNEVQITGEVMKSWIDSKSNVERRKGAKIISSLAQDRMDTYLQIMQRQMLSSVLEGNEDKRRRLIQIFNILHEVDINISEALIKEITRKMAMPSDDTPAVLERSKTTIVRLVLHSRKLTKVAINELLNILDKENPPAAQIWNILTTFDAGMVAIELVTTFSVEKAGEIIRKANFLRFTGSVYTILQEVIKAWKLGDIAAISESAGAILPEETLRKFERLELARKVQKLKMVQLSTLAESLNKDVETVERLVTELIVNDELQAEMKLIDEKMYLVASEQETNSN
ncbi:MAG: 2-phospho-L-lactate transferase [Candidatus Heimdallarchaeota archaeon LC_2]|nr:MAG: 2-phospho-L-lactate transferase [Candidatus Heimdallarchaeota archaeon LC_2]